MPLGSSVPVRLLPLLGVWLLLGCGGAPDRDLVRLTELATGILAEPVTVAQDLRLGREPSELDTDLPASRLGRLSLRARGNAPSIELHWKLASEDDFGPYRKLSVPLAGSEGGGAAQVYQVDLAREPYWIGTIDAMRLRVPSGSLELLELTAAPNPDGARPTSIGGRSLSSLPGLTRLELELPPDAPRRALFETHLGLIPHFDETGTAARFRAWVVPRGADPESGRRVEWLDREIRGTGERSWTRVSEPVDVPAGGRLVLAVEAASHEAPLPEGAAVWGAPMLVSPEPPGEEGPHLIVLLVDTLRADTLGAWGSEENLTPNLDRLAARSIRLDRLHAPAPWTLPSVASLLTGLQPQTHDAGRVLGQGSIPKALGPSPVTLAGLLAEQGFYTTEVYSNPFLDPSFGLSRGFDVYDRVAGEDDARVDRAVEILERHHRDRRLFLLLHLFGPHNPYAPPDDACEVARRLEPGYARDSNGTGPTEPAEEPGDAGNMGCHGNRRPGTPVPPPVDRPWFEALYKAEIAYTDHQVGRFLEALERLGLEDRVVLVMLSDHGEDVWGRVEQLEARGYRDSDHGHTQYQELLLVPGTIRAPGLAPGAVAEPVEVVDLFPTMLRLLGLGHLLEDEEAGLGALQGRDLTPAFSPGNETEASTRRLLVSDFVLYGIGRWSVRKGPWKLIMPQTWEGPGTATPGQPAPELYRLDRDPGETTDVYAEHPEVVNSLWILARRERDLREAERERLTRGDEAVPTTHLEWKHVQDLRALGYLQ